MSRRGQILEAIAAVLAGERDWIDALHCIAVVTGASDVRLKLDESDREVWEACWRRGLQSNSRLANRYFEMTCSPGTEIQLTMAFAGSPNRHQRAV